MFNWKEKKKKEDYIEDLVELFDQFYLALMVDGFWLGLLPDHNSAVVGLDGYATPREVRAADDWACRTLSYGLVETVCWARPVPVPVPEPEPEPGPGSEPGPGKTL